MLRRTFGRPGNMKNQSSLPTPSVDEMGSFASCSARYFCLRIVALASHAASGDPAGAALRTELSMP